MFSLVWITVGFSVIYSLAVGAQRLSEPERVQQWHDEGYVWPPNWHQESDAFKIAMDKRENDILSIDATQERWENFMQFTQSRMLPRFTSSGFAVVSTPSRVQSRLKTKLDDALFHLDQFPDEGTYAGSYRQKPVKIVDFGRSLDDLQPELKAIHENFVNGMELTLSNVYGIRVNQDGSSLAMHYDQQIESNVISSIIHIAHEYFNGDEPWPIEIEDHDGVLHAVNLEPGQMLIYESAACLHGRRRILKGHYYASLFMHYRPTHPQIWNYTIEDVIARVPPHWKEGTTGLHGSRHAGQALTTDSLVSDAAPPRIPSVELDRQLEERRLATTVDAEAARLAQERANILAGYALPASSEGSYQSTQPWPWPYESTAFQGAMDAREKELFTLTGRDERWDNFMLYTQGRLVRRFTERGFKLLQTPAHIQARLKAEVDRAVENFDQIPDENSSLGAYIKYPNKILDIRQVLSEVHRELHPIMEDWVGGMQLVPTSIYGVRLNREGAALAMHYDKVYTHVISSIIHISHEYFSNDDPWPIEIEDHDGVLHAVNLEPGQMLLYESSACLHGRRQVLKGRYYASAFSHYQPVDRAVWNYTIQDVVAHVPKYWSDGLLEEHGSRHAGQALTVDSRIADNAPPRVVLGQEVTDIHAFLDKRKSEL